MAEAGVGFVDILPRTGAFLPQLTKQVGTALKAASASGSSAFAAIGTAGIAAFAVAGVASLKFAADFEHAMDRIRGLVGLTQDQVEGMSQAVLDIAKATAVGPAELADAPVSYTHLTLPT